MNSRMCCTFPLPYLSFFSYCVNHGYVSSLFYGHTKSDSFNGGLLWNKFIEVAERKIDARTISGYFIGYPKRLKGYMFYCSNHSMRIVKTGNARFIGNDEISGSTVPREMEIKEVRV